MASSPNQVMEAIESFVCDLDGERIIVQAPDTRVAASHPLVAAYPGRFRPLEFSYDVEEATSEPGRRSRPSRVPAAEREASEETAATEPSSEGPIKGLTTESLRKSTK